MLPSFWAVLLFGWNFQPKVDVRLTKVGVKSPYSKQLLRRELSASSSVAVFSILDLHLFLLPNLKSNFYMINPELIFYKIFCRKKIHCDRHDLHMEYWKKLFIYCMLLKHLMRSMYQKKKWYNRTVLNVLVVTYCFPQAVAMALRMDMN